MRYFGFRGRWLPMAGALMLAGVLGAGACSDDTETPKGDVAVDLMYAGDQALTRDGLADARVSDTGVSDSKEQDQASIVDGAKGDAPTVHDGMVHDGTVPMDCPKTEPVANASCTQEGKQCGYGSRPDCGNVWECHGGKWVLAFQGDPCTGTTAVCSPQQPSGFCKTSDPVCRYGDIVCTCVGVCSGVQPPPGQDRVWACVNPQTVACPKTSPKNGASCTQNGLVCDYGSCGGSTATCTAGQWDVKFNPPPP
ncbi:MAG: hypothetical protein KAI47_10795 [Deltaproteobacteria bacterium]|nr:hypothetical protein [Deltaproteobacteria bacterium]